MEERRVYEEVRALVESRGGVMKFEKEGYQWGAWIIRMNGNEFIAKSNGTGFPDLDQLYEPKPGASNLNDWRSYTTILKPNAQEQLLQLIEGK
jgi:hypothetical protein